MKLNISERICALGMLNDFKGKLETMADILSDIKQLPVTDAEWEQAQRTVEPLENGSSLMRWNDDEGGTKEVVFQPSTIKYIKDTIEKKSAAGEYTLQDKAVLTLKQQLDSE